MRTCSLVPIAQWWNRRALRYRNPSNTTVSQPTTHTPLDRMSLSGRLATHGMTLGKWWGTSTLGTTLACIYMVECVVKGVGIVRTHPASNSLSTFYISLIRSDKVPHMVPLCCSRRLVLMPGDASVIPGATPTAELHHDIANDDCPVSLCVLVSVLLP
jgi:hypothetical protein